MKNDFLPTASLERLEHRATILRRIRDFFHARNFIEVETPLLSHDICVDRYIQPISVAANVVTGLRNPLNSAGERLWLQTSPEFGMKRLLAAGAVAIYQITKCFRCGERGQLHNPEFTMLEWYRVGDDLHSGMDLLAEFTAELLGRPQTDRLSYRQVFDQHVGMDPHSVSIDQLIEFCRAEGILPEDFTNERNDRDFWLNLILSRRVEGNLGIETPTLVYDWPASQSALAIVRDGDIPVAERFELYVDGIEIANGYHELLDSEVLVKRNSANNLLRVEDGKNTLPEDSRLIAAMRNGIPACAGVALGVDRLVMLLTGAKSLEEVLTFPIEIA